MRFDVQALPDPNATSHDSAIVTVEPQRNGLASVTLLGLSEGFPSSRRLLPVHDGFGLIERLASLVRL